MRNVFYKGRFVFIPIAIVAFLSVISIIVMQLWNNLLPGILHVGAITFWQAMGIFVLCKILFGFGKGGRGFGGGGMRWRGHMMEEKLKHLSPEERERFKQKMNERMCGPRGRGWGHHDWGRQAWGNDQPATEEQKAGE